MLARVFGKAVAQAAALPVPTADSLKAQRTELEAQLRNLTKERDALSLASLSGDANATTAIEAIDRERQRLAGSMGVVGDDFDIAALLDESAGHVDHRVAAITFGAERLAVDHFVVGDHFQGGFGPHGVAMNQPVI